MSSSEPDEIDPAATLATEICRISEAVRRIDRSGLNREAIVVLVAHSTKLAQRDVRAVIESLADMSNDWLRQNKA